jgi:hypothetical protein
MLRVVLSSAALILCLATARADDKDKPVKMTADQIGKEFKDDAEAAKKKYGGKPPLEIELTGSVGPIIGKDNEPQIIIKTASGPTIRLFIDKAQRPNKSPFPTKFTATVTYKDLFSMGTVQELSLKASKITFEK